MNLNEVAKLIISDIEVVIESSNTVISVSDLPEIEGNATQLGQLFQNLITNAIKFQKPGTQPEITISAEIINGHTLPENIVNNDNYAYSQS